jgi:hypothetical protein
LSEGIEYEVSVDVDALAGGTPLIYMQLGNNTVVELTSTGAGQKFRMIATDVATTDSIAFYTDNVLTTCTLDNVSIRTVDRPTLQIIRRPIPENADSIGRPFPIVYGKVEKMWAVWSVSSKSTRQNSISAGDDIYILAGHRIYDKDPTEILVYFGLDENADRMSIKPGTIDFVPNPLPRSVSEIERWHESGFDLRAGDPDKDVSPLHKLIEITTNEGEIATGVQLRGDEYDGWNPSLGDGELPEVDGKPQFPIRYGLGNSKVYVSFRGHADENGTITGVKGGLIEHPIDIIKHFLLNYTNIDGDEEKLDEDSFIKAKARLQDWKFGVAITDIADGDKILERLTKQCKATWTWKNGQFKISVLDLENATPTRYIEEKKHFIGKQLWKRDSISAVYNDFTFKFAYNSITQNYDRVIRRNKKNDPRCRDSFAQINAVRSFKAIELPDVYDSYTANRIADHYVALYAVMRERLQTAVRLDDETRGIEPSEVVSVSLTGPYSALQAHVCLVLSVASAPDGLDIELLRLE